MLESIPNVVRLAPFRNGELRVVPAEQQDTPRSNPKYDSSSRNSCKPQEETLPNQSNKSSSDYRQSSSYVSQNQSQRRLPTTFYEASSSTLYKAPVVTHLPASVADSIKNTDLQASSFHQSCDATIVPEGKPNKSYIPVDDDSDESSQSSNFMFDSDCGVPKKLQQEIRQVLEQKPKGLFASSLPLEYKRLFNRELPFREQGYNSVVEFVSTLPTDLVSIERPNKKGDWLLSDARIKTQLKGHNTQNENTQNEIDRKRDHDNNTEFRESVLQVLLMHPNGIPMQDFHTKYQEFTGKSLSDKIIRYGSLENLCIALSDDVLQINYQGNSCLVLHAIRSNSTRKFNHLLEMYQPHAVDQLKDDHNLPTDVVGPGTYYSQLRLPNFQDYVEIYVSNILSPGVFWIQLRQKNNTIALEKLMDSLEFYNGSSAEQYKIPDSLIAVGQVVATMFPEDQNWHRGIITSIRTIDFVDVYYVDYGNTCSVHKKTLRLLRLRYLKLPAQAVQSRLANIQPLGETWTKTAQSEMLQICTSKPLIALVTASKNRVLSVCLTDTTSDVDVHINDKLVQDGYAKFAPDDLQTTSLYPTDMREIPDEAILYGTTTSAVNGAAGSSATVATASTVYNSATASNDGGSLRFIRPVQLTKDVDIHVINWDNEPWLISAEISSLFWEEDILRSMLQTKRVLVKKLVLSRSENEALFMELLDYEVRSVTESKAFATIYSLKRLPEILDVFHYPNKDVKSRVEEILQDFDPEDEYWQGEDQYMEEDIRRELEETQLGVDKLKLTLQALQFKRKRILQSMLNGVGCKPDLVTQLKEVEMQIKKTEELLDEIEATFGSEIMIEDTPQSPAKSVNRVAPLIVNPVSELKTATSFNTNAAPQLLQTTNLTSTSNLLSEQFMQSMIPMNMDQNMLNMMYPMMQQVPSLGRGHATNLLQQNTLPTFQNMLPGQPTTSTSPGSNQPPVVNNNLSMQAFLRMPFVQQMAANTTQSFPNRVSAMPGMPTSVQIPNVAAAMPGMPTSVQIPNFTSAMPGMSTAVQMPNVAAAMPGMPTSVQMPNVAAAMPTSVQMPNVAAAMPGIPTSVQIPNVAAAMPGIPTSVQMPNFTSAMPGMPTAVQMPNVAAAMPGMNPGSVQMPSLQKMLEQMMPNFTGMMPANQQQNMALLPDLMPLLQNLNMSTSNNSS